MNTTKGIRLVKRMALRLSQALLIALVIGTAIQNIAYGGELYKITFYCSCPICTGKWADGHFASGKEVYDGGVACNHMAFGTKLNIGGRIYTVEDRGSKKYFGTFQDKVKHIDIWMSSHEEALKAGVDYKEVTNG